MEAIMPRLRKEFMDGLAGDPPDKNKAGFVVQGKGTGTEQIKRQKQFMIRNDWQDPSKGGTGYEVEGAKDEAGNDLPDTWNVLNADPKIKRYLRTQQQIQEGRVLSPQEQADYDTIGKEFLDQGNQRQKGLGYKNAQKYQLQDDVTRNYRPAYIDGQVKKSLEEAMQKDPDNAMNNMYWYKNTPDNPNARLPNQTDWSFEDKIANLLDTNDKARKAVTTPRKDGGRLIDPKVGGEDMNFLAQEYNQGLADKNSASKMQPTDLAGVQRRDSITKASDAKMKSASQNMRAGKWNTNQDYAKRPDGSIDLKSPPVKYDYNDPSNKSSDLKGMDEAQIKNIMLRQQAVEANKRINPFATRTVTAQGTSGYQGTIDSLNNYNRLNPTKKK